jgi:hypothetical protein
MKKLIDFIKQNRWAGYIVAILITAIVVGFAVYTLAPSKTLEIEVRSQEDVKTINTLSQKLNNVTNLYSTLNSQFRKECNIEYYENGNKKNVHCIREGSSQQNASSQSSTSVTTNQTTQTEARYTYEEWSKLEINKTAINANLFATIGPNIRGINLLIDGDVFGKLGMSAGFGIMWDMPLISITPVWPKPDFVGHAGLRYRFR